MSVTLQWLVEGRVIVSYVWDDFSEGEMAVGVRKAEQMMETGTPLIHDIIDMRHMGKHPINIRRISELMTIFRDDRLGWVVLVSENDVVRFLSRTVLSLVRGRFRAVATPEEAIAFLQEIDETLPRIPLYDTELLRGAKGA